MGFDTLNTWNRAVIVRGSTPEEVIERIASIPVKPDLRYFGLDTGGKSWVAVIITSYKIKTAKKKSNQGE